MQKGEALRHGCQGRRLPLVVLHSQLLSVGCNDKDVENNDDDDDDDDYDELMN